MLTHHILVDLVVPSCSFRGIFPTHLCHFYSFLSFSRRRVGAVFYTRGIIFGVDFHTEYIYVQKKGEKLYQRIAFVHFFRPPSASESRGYGLGRGRI